MKIKEENNINNLKLDQIFLDGKNKELELQEKLFNTKGLQINFENI